MIATARDMGCCFVGPITSILWPFTLLAMNKDIFKLWNYDLILTIFDRLLHRILTKVYSLTRANVSKRALPIILRPSSVRSLVVNIFDTCNSCYTPYTFCILYAMLLLVGDRHGWRIHLFWMFRANIYQNWYESYDKGFQSLQIWRMAPLPGAHEGIKTGKIRYNFIKKSSPTPRDMHYKCLQI